MAQDEQRGSATLDAADRQNLKVIMQVLEPFKTAQMFLDGDEFIKTRWVLPAIKNCRVKLAELATAQKEAASSPLASNMLHDFEQRQGILQFPQFAPTVRPGYRNRQIGIHPALMIVTFWTQNTRI